MTNKMKAFKQQCAENAKFFETDMKASRFEERMELAKAFFNQLSDILKNDYVVVGSCNKDDSCYLIPKGTEDQITYYGKPDKSFRISDHWNWYSNLQKCSNPNYIQCLSVDMPHAFQREEEGKATKARRGIQVAIIGDDGKYHHVFGERFVRKTKTWEWIENDPMDICRRYGLIAGGEQP